MQQAQVIGGRYQIVKKIGQGGKGSVYLVMNLRTERFWAAKRIMVPGGEACHELEMMKNLRNIHLPQIMDVFSESEFPQDNTDPRAQTDLLLPVSMRQETESEAWPAWQKPVSAEAAEDSSLTADVSGEGSAAGQVIWLIMEFVRGIPYDHYIRDGRTLPELQALETGIQVSDALCYLQKHDPPVYHLDIKPENLIRTRDGRVKLVDFGSAWKKDTVLQNEGTVGYAAPEQLCRGKPKDARTDIFGLGATLYRLVAGKKYSRILRQGQVPGCGQPFSDVIRKCLQENPDDRFQSAEQLRNALIHVRRSYARENMKKQLLAAFALALPAAAFCVSVIPTSIDFSEDEKWNYDKILEEARVVPEDTGREYYRKAIFMKPQDPQAYLNFIDDVAADGVFSDSEETFLRDLLHTVPLGEENTYEEILKEKPSSYGPVASRLGITYRYQYPGEAGRRIAAGWFSKAQEAGRRLGFSEPEEFSLSEGMPQAYSGTEAISEAETDGGEDRSDYSADTEKKPDWLRQAEYYLLLSALDETPMQKSPDTGEETALEGDPSTELDHDELSAEDITAALSYWNLLEQRKSAAGMKEDPLLTIQRLYDTAWQIAFRATDLRRAGISSGQIEDEMGKIADEASDASASGKISSREKAAKKLIEGIKDAARVAEERLSGT